MFDDDEIVDELIDFQGAATVTTRNSIVTLISQLASRPDVLNKVRSELETRIGNAENTEEHFSLLQESLTLS